MWDTAVDVEDDMDVDDDDDDELGGDDDDDDEHDDDLKSPGTCERRPSLDIQRTTALTISLRQAGIPFT